MKKIIAFSLWGKNSMYTIGAIRNAELQSDIYPGWKCRFYYGSDVPSEVIKKLKKLGSELILVEQRRGYEGLFWRFRAARDSDIMLSRDTDSRLNKREAAAVQEWIDSGKKFHIMRDHPWHNVKILGGMWGCRGFPAITSLLRNWKRIESKGWDQDFLSKIIWPLIKNDVLIHDEIVEPKATNTKKFPTNRDNKHFVGEIFDENDQRHSKHWKML